MLLAGHFYNLLLMSTITTTATTITTTTTAFRKQCHLNYDKKLLGDFQYKIYSFQIFLRIVTYWTLCRKYKL